MIFFENPITLPSPNSVIEGFTKPCYEYKSGLYMFTNGTWYIQTPSQFNPWVKCDTGPKYWRYWTC